MISVKIRLPRALQMRGRNRVVAAGKNISLWKGPGWSPPLMVALLEDSRSWLVRTSSLNDLAARRGRPPVCRRSLWNGFGKLLWSDWYPWKTWA
jgi:hypothetical protein